MRVKRWIGLATLALLAGIITGTGWTATAAGCSLSEEIDAVDFIATVPTFDLGTVIDDLVWRGPATPRGFRRLTVRVDQVAVGAVHEVEDVDLSTTEFCGPAPSSVQAGRQYRFTGSRHDGTITVSSAPSLVAETGASAVVPPAGRVWRAPTAGVGPQRDHAWTDLNVFTFGMLAAGIALPYVIRRTRRHRASIATGPYDAPGWPAS